MFVGLIVANSKNGVIGKDGHMPWNLPGDLRRFKKITANSIIIMGRKTHESIGKVLLNRYNFVISKGVLKTPGIHPFSNIESSLEFAKLVFPECKIFVIGGASIYKQFLRKNLVNRIYQTVIDKDFEGDTFFDFDKENWKIIEEIPFEEGDNKGTYITWEKEK